MFTAIVVPTDGSLLSERAIAYARQLATTSNAHVILVRAHLPLDDALSERMRHISESPAQLGEREHARSESEFSVLVERLREKGFELDARFVEGPAAEVIVDTAREVKANLIVMSSHGRSGLGRLVYGSVAQHVLQEVPIPVLMISPRCADGWDERPGKRILVPLDGSDRATEALRPALDLARAISVTELILLAVVEAPVGTYPDALVQVVSVPTEQSVQAMHYLEAIASRLRDETPLHIRLRVAHGDPADVIVAVARQENADAIAMATHGQSGLAHVMLGSVALRTLEQNDVPLLLCRPISLAPSVLEHAVKEAFARQAKSAR